MHNPSSDQRTYGDQIHDRLRSLPDPSVDPAGYRKAMAEIALISTTAVVDVDSGTGGRYRARRDDA